MILIFCKEHTMENTFKGSKNYVASPELMNAVNIAMALKKPLLIKGEPGTGKTMLAEAVAEALGKKLIIWSVKSTTKAQDGLYVYDVVQRLYDSQFRRRAGRAADRRGRQSRPRVPERPSLGARQDGILHSRDEGDHQGQAPSHRHHHLERGKGAAGRVPAPLHLPLY